MANNIGGGRGPRNGPLQPQRSNRAAARLGQNAGAGGAPQVNVPAPPPVIDGVDPHAPAGNPPAAANVLQGPAPQPVQHGGPPVGGGGAPQGPPPNLVGVPHAMHQAPPVPLLATPPLDGDDLQNWASNRYALSVETLQELAPRLQPLRQKARNGRLFRRRKTDKRAKKALHQIAHGLKKTDRKHYKDLVSGIDKLDRAIRKMSNHERDTDTGKELIRLRSDLARRVIVGTNRTQQLRSVLEGKRARLGNQFAVYNVDMVVDGKDNHRKARKHTDTAVPNNPADILTLDQLTAHFDSTRFAVREERTDKGIRGLPGTLSRYVYGLRGGRTLPTMPLRAMRAATGKGKRTAFRPLLKGNIASRSGDIRMNDINGRPMTVGIVRYGSPTTQTSADNAKGDPVFRAYVESLPDGDVHLHIDNQKSEKSLEREWEGILKGVKDTLVNDVFLGEVKKEADRSAAARKMATDVNRAAGVVKMLSPKIPADSDLYKATGSEFPGTRGGAQGQFVDAAVRGDHGFDIDPTTKAIMAHSLGIPNEAAVAAMQRGTVNVDGVEKPVFDTAKVEAFMETHGAAVDNALREHWSGLLANMHNAFQVPENNLSRDDVWAYNVLARAVIELDMIQRTRPSTTGTVCKEMCDRGALNAAVLVMLSGMAQENKGIADVVAETEVLLHGSALDVHQRDINDNYQDVPNLLLRLRDWDGGGGDINTLRGRARAMFQGFNLSTAGFSPDNTGVPKETKDRQYTDPRCTNNRSNAFKPYKGAEGLGVPNQ